MTVCEHHKIMLVDGCPHCKKPVNIKWGQEEFESHATCPNCGDDLTTTKPPELEDIDRHLSWQQRLDSVVNQGWIELDGMYIDSLLFFIDLRQIMFSLARGPKAYELRRTLTRRIKAPMYTENPNKSLKEIEMLSVSNRLSLLAPLGWLFDDWPNRFIEIFKSKRVTPKNLFHNMTNIPYWYKTAVDNLLTSRPFPTRIEINNAIGFLEKNKYSVGEINLELLLGRKLRKHVDFSKYPYQEFRTKYPDGETELGKFAIRRAIHVFGEEEKAMQCMKNANETFNFRRPIDKVVYLKGAFEVIQCLNKMRSNSKWNGT